METVVLMIDIRWKSLQIVYHGEHFGELSGGAGEHGGHNEVEKGHELQEVVLQGRSGQQQAVLRLQGRRERLMKDARKQTEESKCRQQTNVNGHEVAVAQRVHVLQHVAFVKHGVLQTQLAKQAAVAVISDGQVIPVESNRSKVIDSYRFISW